jgi:hypothetical protein
MDEKKFSSVSAGHLIAMNILARKGLLHLFLKTMRDIGPTNRHKIPSILKEEAPPKLPDIHAFMIMFAYCCTMVKAPK